MSKLVLGKRWADPSGITPERVGHVFRWSELKSVHGTGKSSNDTLGESLTVRSTPETIVYTRAFRNFTVGQKVDYPAHLDFGVNPEFGYVGSS